MTDFIMLKSDAPEEDVSNKRHLTIYTPATPEAGERIEACLSACTGIPTLALKEGAVRELVAATELLLKTAQHFEQQASQGTGGRRGGPVFTRVRAALAKFKEEG